MTIQRDVERRFERFVEHHVMRGEALDLAELCAGREDLIAPLEQLVAQYMDLSSGFESAEPLDDPAPALLPSFEGFRTIERIGAGGMGEVYKLQDLTLNRIVAAKVVRADRAVQARLGAFIREARALALFDDRRVVQIHEFRHERDVPVIIMEYVDGFELGRLAPSLEMRQRGQIVREVADAIHHAHTLGVQHRDLKPSNILLDARLSPKILDFGLAATSPAEGHFRGTLPFTAPELLDPAQPIDERADIYALGVILYQLLCGSLPYTGRSDAETVAAIREGAPRLPIEIDPRVPEPLQAIALKAMERRAADRYASAREMVLDFDRYLAGRPVLARPTLYASTLGTRVAPHLAQIDEWLRLKLIYPHEAASLRSAYRQLDAREDDWIVESRTLSYSQIALYLGAFLLVCGSLFYFGAHRLYDAVKGLGRPLVVLGLPFVGLNAAAHHLYNRDHKAVAVAFYLAGAGLLPLLLLIVFHETGLWVAAPGSRMELFADGAVSNRQLQLTIFIASAWSAVLAFRTRTVALSTVVAVLLFLFAIAVLADFGLRAWIIDGNRFDLFALHLSPLVAAYAALGAAAEAGGRSWLARPLYLGASATLVAVLELLAWNGRAFHYLGVSLQGLQSPKVSDPVLIDTLVAMTINGVLFYAAAALLQRYGSELKQVGASMLFALSPFAVLQPLGYLVKTGEYSPRLDWYYLVLALGIALLSQRRQRRSFYYAGLINTGLALYLIASHRQWFDRPAWAIVIIAAGLAALGAGFWLDARRRAARGQG